MIWRNGSNWGSTTNNAILQYFQQIPHCKSVFLEKCLPILITEQQVPSQLLSRVRLRPECMVQGKFTEVDLHPPSRMRTIHRYESIIPTMNVPINPCSGILRLWRSFGWSTWCRGSNSFHWLLWNGRETELIHSESIHSRKRLLGLRPSRDVSAEALME
jgi:hypothetical protein